MGKKKGKLYIGTSGYHYKHWIEKFYPKNLNKKDWLSYYIKFFKTLELNNPFYKLPSPETFDTWRKAVPEDFIFSVKGSRFITHNKKLKEPWEALSRLLENSSWLHDKLGPVLFQLPPKWNYNGERLKNFAEKLPKDYKYAIEFRNHTWYKDEAYKILEENNISFCIYELEYHQSPIEVTADFVYIRLHGPKEKYSGLYEMDQLHEWAENMKQWSKEGKDVFVYFDNDQNAYAAKNAIQLRQIIENTKIEVPEI